MSTLSDGSSSLNEKFSSSFGSSTPTVSDSVLGDGVGSAPEHGRTYLIIESSSGRAISLPGALVGGDRLLLQAPGEGFAAKKHWLCVEKDGYLGFQNPASGRFMGHDGSWEGGGISGVRASATVLEQWELFTLRPHPEGGNLLLSPHTPFRLNVVTTSADGKGLEVRQNGRTTWKFIKI
ncbi:hypothetical protein V2G26_019561 [Clonostachys chloroleuca]|uniref:Uncharacterized protein n=1 Tax=Clonostachys chloroleuca TaxID=1926264 RepID=A0AA35M0K0_9HYPO|nr:unnamed protein product [Clonostachys chloroleuca]